MPVFHATCYKRTENPSSLACGRLFMLLRRRVGRDTRGASRTASAGFRTLSNSCVHHVLPAQLPPRASSHTSPPAVRASNRPSDCSVCEEGYAPGLSYGCNSCSSGGTLMATAVVFIFIAVVVLVAILLDLMAVGAAAPLTGRRNGLDAKFRRLKDFIPFHSLKIAVVSWQIITQARVGGG